MATPTRKRLTQGERVAESAQRLMDAAIELIAEKGFERTTATEIAERAGYSHGMVKARYGSKEILLEELVRKGFEDLLLPDASPLVGLDHLLGWIAKMRRNIASNQQLIRAFYTLTFEAAAPVPSLRPWTQGWLDRCVREASDCLHTAQQDGTIRAELDAEAEAEIFVSAGVGVSFRYILSGDLAAYDRALDRLRARFEDLRVA